MIFNFYYQWLLKIGNVQIDEEGNILNKETYRKFIKPIGFCIACTNVWITILSFMAILNVYIFSELSLILPIKYMLLLPYPNLITSQLAKIIQGSK